MGELLVCLAFTSDDRKWSLRLAAVICTAWWGHICASNFQALDNPSRCHSKAFYVFSPRVFRDGSSFCTEVPLAWRTTCQVSVNALIILTITNHKHSLKLFVIQGFSSELCHGEWVTCSCKNCMHGWKIAFDSSRI